MKCCHLHQVQHEEKTAASRQRLSSPAPRQISAARPPGPAFPFQNRDKMTITLAAVCLAASSKERNMSITATRPRDVVDPYQGLTYRQNQRRAARCCIPSYLWRRISVSSTHQTCHTTTPKQQQATCGTRKPRNGARHHTGNAQEA